MSDVRTITVYGASDDLLEVEGDLELEAPCYNAGAVPVEVNGQHALTVEYGNDGMWKITIAALPDGVTASLLHTAVDDPTSNRHSGTDFPSYSDVITLTGPIETITAHGEVGVLRRPVS